MQDGRGHRRAEVELGHAAEPAPAVFLDGAYHERGDELAFEQLAPPERELCPLDAYLLAE